MPAESSTEYAFLSTERAGPREFQFAVAAGLVSGVIFLAALPFAKIPLGQVQAFTPMYVSALVICDLITAVLLFGQFGFLRSGALLILACAYLFTASMTASYVFMFPGLFSPTGLLGAGPQSTSAMYIFWHAGFPLLVTCYALSRKRRPVTLATNATPRPGTRLVMFSSIAAVLAIVAGYTVLATAGHAHLPVFINDNRTSDLGHIVLAGDGLLSIVALIVLLWRRPYTVIDLWLMVVMGAWLCDLALAAILNSGRYDLGWYVGRIYGLLAASSLLVMLLIENGVHYARLVRMSESLGEANDALERLARQDSLTGLANRRFFDTYLTTQLAVAHRHRRVTALVLCDVDDFKAYNDQYGHLAGDECLRRVAAALKSCCRRPADMAARYGGEEFAMILPDTEMPGAVQFAELARAAVARLRIPHAASRAVPYITISGGVAVTMGKDGMSAEQLIMSADRGLFHAKRLGRNRVISERAQSEPTSATTLGRADSLSREGVLPAADRGSGERAQRMATATPTTAVPF